VIRRMREFDWVGFPVRRPVVAALVSVVCSALGAYIGAVLLSLTWQQGALLIAIMSVFTAFFQLRANLQLRRAAGKR
jgi:putative Mn2+ efflux pump MntP